MNKVILLGRVGSDPEVKEFTDVKICKFSLATSKRYKKNGEKVEYTTWHNLIFLGIQCDTLKQYVHKGDQLLVEGEIQTRQYEDKNKVTHWTTEIICNKFELLGKKEESPKAKAEPDKSGKTYVPSMSNPDDLPQHIKDAEDVPDDLSDLPF